MYLRFMVESFRFVLLVLCLGVYASIYGQFPGAGTRGQSGAGGFGSPQSNYQDTVQRPPFDYIAYDLSDVRKSFSGTIDTSIHRQHLVESYFKGALIGGNLGSEISSLHPFIFDYAPEPLSLGQAQYDFLLERDDFDRIYSTNRDWFEARYSTSYFFDNNAQGDGANFGIDFYKTFARKITLNLRYETNNDFGIFQQSGRTRAPQISQKQLNIKMMQRSKNDRRISYIHYNNPRIEENIVGTSPVVATIFSQKRKIELGNSILFGDSTALANESIRWDSKLSFKKDVYKLNDASVTAEEQLFYGFDTLPNDINYANDVRRLVWSNEFSSSLEKMEYKVGVNFENTSLLQRDTVKITDLSFLQPYVSGTYRLSKSSYISGQASLGLASIAGDRRLKVAYHIVEDDYQLEIGARFDAISPTIMHRFSLFNQIDQIERDFSATSRQGLFASVVFPKLELSVKGAFDYYSNFLFPNFSNWRQIDDQFSVFQISAEKPLNLGPFKTNHNIGFQQVNNNIIPRGQFQYHGNVFLQSHLFKKNMLAQLGADIYVIPSFNQPSFQPLFGTFFSDGQGVLTENVVMVNPYLNCQVDRFHFFVKGVHVIRQVLPASHELVATYPSFPLRLRVGMRWSLLD